MERDSLTHHAPHRPRLSGLCVRPRSTTAHAFVASIVAVALGLLVLLGWASGLGALSAFLPSALPMKRRAS
jgi:hypothetical protein